MCWNESVVRDWDWLWMQETRLDLPLFCIPPLHDYSFRSSFILYSPLLITSCFFLVLLPFWVSG